MELAGKIYRDLCNSMRDVIVVTDLGHNILDANQPALREVFGYETGDITAKKGRILFATDDAYESAGREVFDNMEYVQGKMIEVDLIKKNGEIFKGEMYSLKLTDTNGRPTGNIAVIRDISYRKHVEYMLKESEERYRRIVGGITDYIYSVRVEGGKAVETIHSDACVAVTGYHRREFADDPYLWIRMVLEEDRNLVRQQIEQVLAGRSPQPVEHRIVKKGGNMRWVESVIVPCTDANGVLISYDGIVRDITERKRAEEALQESEKRFRTIFESSPAGITIADPRGRLVRTNPAFQRMTGYTENELNREFISITHPEDVKENLRFFREMLDGKRDHYRMEKRFMRKDGGIIWANVSVTAIRDNSGSFRYNFAIIEDMTERKHLEDQLRHAQKMEAIGQLAGGVAHDFNNMLTAIIGYGSLLRMKLGSDSQLLPHIEKIIEITDRGAALTRGLLAFSRKQVIELRPLQLNELVGRIVKILPKLIGEDIEIRTKLSAADLIISADSGQIEQVLMNLAANARDAMPEGGVLTIDTQRVDTDAKYVENFNYMKHGAYALLTVADTGTGMDKETMKKIFDPFFTTKAVGEGTGLGLAMTYGIIKQHNGYIHVESELKRGSVFKIHLPLINEEIGEKQPADSQYMVGGSETILIAEDETEVRNVIRELLEEFGYNVIEAVDGVDAVEKFLENKAGIHILLFDLIMPRKNGKEAYEEIRKVCPDMKVVFISGYTGRTIDARGLFQEGANFLQKPVAPQALLKKIREQLDNK